MKRTLVSRGEADLWLLEHSVGVKEKHGSDSN